MEKQIRIYSWTKWKTFIDTVRKLVTLVYFSTLEIYPAESENKNSTELPWSTTKKFRRFLEVSLIFVKYAKKAITFNWHLPSLSNNDR